ncbi:hypothetical protein GCM10010399_44890 [Dactylosporangium fulvum]
MVGGHVEGDGAAANAADEALLLQLVKVATDGHLRDAEPFRQLTEGEPAAATDQAEGEVSRIRLTSTSNAATVAARPTKSSPWAG